MRQSLMTLNYGAGFHHNTSCLTKMRVPSDHLPPLSMMTGTEARCQSLLGQRWRVLTRLWRATMAMRWQALQQAKHVTVARDSCVILCPGHQLMPLCSDLNRSPFGRNLGEQLAG